MLERARSYLALLLVMSCPVFCRAGTADACCTEGSSHAQAGKLAHEPAGHEKPAPASDPCGDVSCFCSPCIMKEQPTDVPALTLAIVLPAVDAVSHDAVVARADGLFRAFDRPPLPAMPADGLAALPLLI